tara:strand:- start:1647 stop:2456 length:810 start_codon:yes stop_codon:yes gene_type:complete
MKKILLIGCGHMGDALLSSWKEAKRYQLNVVDPIKYNLIKKKHKSKFIKTFKSVLSLPNNTNYDFVVLAMRPVDLDNALNSLVKIKLKNNISLISVIAGKKLEVFQKKLKNINNFFRVMPNMPATIGQSMNCVVHNKKINKMKINEVKQLFSYSGKTIFFKNENQIDMATAVSGSGPGFVFNLIDAMENAATKLGFNKDEAKILVSQTFRGSINLLINQNMSAKDLVKRVATKGGTTEAGLKVMNNSKVHKTFIKLVRASYKKSKNQGK